MACLGAIELLGWPLTRIITADVWATNDIPADPPLMLEFMRRADRTIKDRWGIEVEHVRADFTYEDVFYRQRATGPNQGVIYGFPMIRGAWCNSRLKVDVLRRAERERERERKRATSRMSALRQTSRRGLIDLTA